MSTRFTRRQFLERATLGTAGLWLASTLPAFSKISPNEKLNLGIVGVAGRGGANLNGVAGENIVALCDIDDKNLAAAGERFPAAKRYNDFRRLVDQNDIDAIVVSTPDHTHAVASMAALQSGRHLYCEKPLTHTVAEARRITETAMKLGRITQIGTQIHAGDNYRRVVELVRSGAIGPVKEVHVWVSATYGGHDLPKTHPPVPENLHYDLWLGPAPYHPYSPEFVPFAWRNWWDFGGGALADFGCHYMDLPHWALGLRHPNSVEVLDGPPVHPDSTPPWLIVRYEHPARDQQPPVTLTWYHGGKQPKLLTPEQAQQWKSGVLFIGGKGQLLADYGRHVLLPEQDFAGFKPPEPFIPNSIGHHKEWLEAIKNNGKTTCSFDYSGPLTETALLGNVAYRAGCKLDWDWKAMKAANCPAADKYVHYKYRDGWKL